MSRSSSVDVSGAAGIEPQAPGPESTPSAPEPQSDTFELPADPTDSLVSTKVTSPSIEALLRCIEREVEPYARPVVTAFHSTHRDRVTALLGPGRHLWQPRDLEDFILHMLNQGDHSRQRPEISFLKELRERDPTEMLPLGSALDTHTLHLSPEADEPGTLLVVVEHSDCDRDVLRGHLSSLAQATSRAWPQGVRSAPSAVPEIDSRNAVIRKLKDRLLESRPSQLETREFWDEVLRLSGAAAGALVLCRPEQDEAPYLYGYGNTGLFLQDEVVKRVEESYRLYANRPSVRAEVVGWDGLNAEAKEIHDLKSYFFVPIQDERIVRGLLFLGCEAENEFSSETIGLFNILAGDERSSTRILRRERRTSGERLGPVVQSMADGVILVDRDGAVLSLNRSAERFLGIEAEGGVRSLDDLQAKGYSDLAGFIRRSMESGRDVLGFELRSTGGEKGRTGHERQVLHVDLFGIEGPEREIWATACVLKDVTELAVKRDEERDLVSTVSHEMRTPLTAMKNSLQILLGETPGPLSERQRGFLELNLRNVDRLSRMLDDLLETARLESGRVGLNPIWFRLDDVIASSAAGTQQLAEKRGIRIETTAAHDSVYLDQDKMTQIVINLVENAVKFTPSGGRVRIEAGKARSADSPRSVWSCLPGCPAVRIAVEDNGKGIDAASLEKVFEKYYRGPDAGERESTGTGLGLAITKRLVEAHDGEIEIESKVGAGTRVHVILPASPSALTAAPKWREVVRRLDQAEKQGESVAVLLIAKPAGIEWSPAETVAETGGDGGREGENEDFFSLTDRFGVFLTRAPNPTRRLAAVAKLLALRGGRCSPIDLGDEVDRYSSRVAARLASFVREKGTER